MVLRYVCMMFYDVICEGFHSRGISMHMPHPKAMGVCISLITIRIVGSNGFSYLY
jgi:hypothetical protein